MNHCINPKCNKSTAKKPYHIFLWCKTCNHKLTFLQKLRIFQKADQDMRKYNKINKRKGKKMYDN